MFDSHRKVLKRFFVVFQSHLCKILPIDNVLKLRPCLALSQKKNELPLPYLLSVAVSNDFNDTNQVLLKGVLAGLAPFHLPSLSPVNSFRVHWGGMAAIYEALTHLKFANLSVLLDLRGK